MMVARGGKPGAHFLWKWGYHFTNYWCNYSGRPEGSMGTKPIGTQMGTHVEAHTQNHF